MHGQTAERAHARILQAVGGEGLSAPCIKRSMENLIVSTKKKLCSKNMLTNRMNRAYYEDVQTETNACAADVEQRIRCLVIVHV